MAYICRLMKTLIIHPEDYSTEFLSQIYAPIVNKTVITEEVSKSEIPKLIESHDRVLILGHGSPDGLLSVDMFPDAGSYIIDDSMVIPLKNKTNSLFIWCHADKFVQRHGLLGLYSGMFISQDTEASYYGVDYMDWGLIDQSNDRFAAIVSKYLNESMEILYQKLLYEYELLARINPIARFNLERLYLTCSGTNKNPMKVVAI
jgi:hypothetical protein